MLETKRLAFKVPHQITVDSIDIIRSMVMAGYLGRVWCKIDSQTDTKKINRGNLVLVADTPHVMLPRTESMLAVSEQGGMPVPIEYLQTTNAKWYVQFFDENTTLLTRFNYNALVEKVLAGYVISVSGVDTTRPLTFTRKPRIEYTEDGVIKRLYCRYNRGEVTIAPSEHSLKTRVKDVPAWEFDIKPSMCYLEKDEDASRNVVTMQPVKPYPLWLLKDQPQVEVTAETVAEPSVEPVTVTIDHPKTVPMDEPMLTPPTTPSDADISAAIMAYRLETVRYSFQAGNVVIDRVQRKGLFKNKVYIFHRMLHMGEERDVQSGSFKEVSPTICDCILMAFDPAQPEDYYFFPYATSEIQPACNKG